MVRVPDELKCWLKQEAEKNRRSLNGELLVRLEESRSQQVKDAKQKLQDEFDELQLASDKSGKSVKDAEAQREELSKRCSQLEAEIAELKSSQDDTHTASAEELLQTKEKLKAA